MLPLALPLVLALQLPPARAADVPHPAQLAGDEALALLAEGRGAAAIRLIQARLRQAEAPEEQAALRCILGAAQARYGDPEDALRSLGEVPLTAACGRRAAFDRADALVQLGRLDEAAALYAEVGALAMGGGRDAELARRLQALAERVLTDPDQDDGRAFELLALGLELELLPADRLALAERLATLLLAERDAGRPADAQLLSQAGEALMEALRRAGLEPEREVELRRLAARTGSPWAGWSLLEPLAADAATLRVRAAVAEGLDGDSQLSWLEQAVGLRPDDRELRADLARILLERGRLDGARRELQVLAGGDDERAARALLDLARVELDLGEDPLAAGDLAVAHLADWLTRFPTGRDRAEVEALLAQTHLSLARRAMAAGPPAEALRRYDAFLAAHPVDDRSEDASWEAAMAARAAGDLPEARRRLEELTARAPHSAAAQRAVSSLARLRALDQGELEAAIAWLRGLEKEGGALASAAAAERERLLAPDVSVEVPGRLPSSGSPSVRVFSRNVDEVTVRLHRVDAEAFLRAGGSPEGLAELDVAVIAPDREWTAPVPAHRPGEDLAWDLPLRVPGPGFYAVTVATDRREARVVVLVSDLELLVRAVGPDLVAGVIAEGRPLAGAQVLVAHGGMVDELRTGADGLARARVLDGQAVVLADGPRGPALATVAWPAAEPEAEPSFAIDLDRPAWRPGDTVGFRLAARDPKGPLKGRIELWLEHGGEALPGLTLEADARGAVHGELRLPAWGGDGEQQDFELMARLPGEDEARFVASLPVIGEQAMGRSLRAFQSGHRGHVEVREADGAPAVDVPVEIERGPGTEPELRRTDARGRVEVEGPPAGVDWRLQARLAGSDEGVWAVDVKELPPLVLDLDQRRIALGGALRLRASGPMGPAVLSIERRLDPREEPPVPLDPWTPAIDEALRGPRSWTEASPEPLPDRGVIELRRMTLSLGEGAAPVDLGDLPEGRYRLRLFSGNARHVAAVEEFEVGGEGPRLGPVASTVIAGQRLDLPVSGLSLVTAEGRDLVAAALVQAAGPRAGGTVRLDLPWQDGPLRLVATDPQGRTDVRDLEIDAHLEVALDVEELGDRWRVRATVTGPDGAPVRAQVALSAADRRLVDRMGPGEGIGLDFLQAGWLTGSGGAVAAELLHGALSEAISAALLAETAREEEARRAQAAAQGRFNDSRMAEIMEQGDLMLEGLGSSGYGLGGGGSGYGSGLGGLGTRGRGGIGGSAALALQAWRARTLWAVGETDAQGVLTVDMDRPPPGRWLLRASALHERAVGADQEERASDAAPFLVLPELGEGGPEELAMARVTVVNGGETAAELQLQVGEDQEPLSLAPGEARALPLPPLSPGQEHRLRLLRGEEVLAERTLRFPLATPTVPDAAGTLVRAAVGPGGGLPLALLAMEADPEVHRDLGRAARAGRAALAVLPALSGAEREAVAQRATDMLSTVRTAGRIAGNALDQAELAAFLFEAQALLPAQRVSRGEVDMALAGLSGMPEDSRDRVAQLWATASAGREIDGSVLGRLVREAEALDPETRSWLARVLLDLDRADEAGPLVAGEGVHATIARRRLGLPTTLSAFLPPVGHPDRAHWLTAATLPPATRPRQRGTAELRVDGRVAGTLDLARGGDLRVQVPAGATVTLDGGAGALLQRGGPPPGELSLDHVRVPVGVDGTPVEADPDPRPQGCGQADGPCRLSVGDLLRLEAVTWAPGASPGAGLSLHEQGVLARVPGRYVLQGLQAWREGQALPAAPLVVEVVPALALDPETLDQGVVLALADEAAAAGGDGAALLAPWPAFDDWDPSLRPEATRIRFEQARRTDAPEVLIAGFEALRDADPGASLRLSDVEAVARAYARVGQPRRAVEAWRAGLGAAFLAEAAPIRRLEDIAGRVVSLRSLRDLALRYPAVPVVDEAEFHLPERLAALADEELPPELVEEGVTATDVRLLSAAWDREFLALHAGSPLLPQAGFHLAQGLLRLRAWQAAADWADRVADRSPEAPVLDGLRYIQGLALAELGQHAASRTLLGSLVDGEWPQEDGSRGPAGLRPDAEYALARLAEARGDLEAAREGYAEVGDAFPEALRAAAALSQVSLSPEPLVVLEAGDPAVLPVQASNVDTIFLRATRLDLRTVFLRDGGLHATQSVQVSGVSPAWTGRRAVKAGPFPEALELALPLAGAGAWLVQLEAPGVEARSLVVRSELSLSFAEGPGGRRLVVRRSGQPAAGVEVRALGGDGQVVATRTDLRGVAMVPPGSAALVFQGEHVAFTDPDVLPVSSWNNGYEATGVEGDLLRNLDVRVQQQRMRNEAGFEEQYKAQSADMVEASRL